MNSYSNVMRGATAFDPDAKWTNYNLNVFAAAVAPARTFHKQVEEHRNCSLFCLRNKTR